MQPDGHTPIQSTRKSNKHEYDHTAMPRQPLRTRALHQHINRQARFARLACGKNYAW